MKINEEQFDMLLATMHGISAVQVRHVKDTCQRLAAIERDVNVFKGVGQQLLRDDGVLLERLDAALKAMDVSNADHMTLASSLQQIKGELLLKQFKGGKPCRKQKKSRK